MCESPFEWLPAVAGLELQRQLEDEKGLRKQDVRELRSQVIDERRDRIAAQNGLVPYVRALEEFNRRFHAGRVEASEVESDLRELGLWDVKLGYDPMKDLRLSVVSPHRI